MKQVILGEEKGYLIPKKVVEDKLRKKFDVLKDKRIIDLDKGYKICTIDYEPKHEVEKKKDHVIIHDPEQEVTETLVFKKELLNELLGLKGNIFRISLKVVRDKAILDNCYIGHSDAECEGYMFGNNDVYYFFEMKDYKIEYFCEMS